MSWERVVTVEEFYDRPRRGVAYLDGKLHVYESPFDDVEDDYSEIYRLAPIDEALFPLIEEQWSIWVRWLNAFKRAETSRDTHPALPVDRERYNVLKSQLAPHLMVVPDGATRMRAEFGGVGWKGQLVRWTPPEADSPPIIE